MNAQLTLFLKPLKAILLKNHSFIFFTISALLIAASIYSLYDVLTLSNPTAAETSTSSISGFDKKTIDQIKQLRDSSDTPENIVFPSPRSNPFVEKQ